MSKHLERDLEGLKRDLLAMGSMVEAATNKAILSLTDRRQDLAQEVLNGDHAINAMENRLEEECLKVLALHQPVAADLRFIIIVLKVNNDLERMGDVSVNIAERAVHLSAVPALDVSLDFPRMTEGVRSMVQDSLDALVDQDTKLARSVLTRDDEIDDINRDMFAALERCMRENPDTVGRAVQLLSVSRHLERIADLATNIAEDVVFMVEGVLIRHQHEGMAPD